ncbi:MAG: prepilin-type N-terminal cleavage/methylation domain-containing protein [Acidobacteria bacterium]|nr:prepilin-type N-terminal cleavage/methylation domain-containing protein [Acidobacteriota bacterium]
MVTNFSRQLARLRDQRGFNLIELMIVIAIIGLLIGVGSIAWQAVISSGNETTAAQSIENIRKFQAQYATRNRGNFATFDELVEKVGLDEKFKGERPVVNGYIFTMTVEPSSSSRPAFYSITADPQVAEGITATGKRHFYTDSSLSTIKATDENRPAKADDPSI